MVLTLDKDSQFIYEDIASKIEFQISKGLFKPGDQIPSLRKLSKDFGVSTKTVEQSYILLESKGLIEAKPQKGYYVKKNIRLFPEIEFNKSEPVISTYSGDELVVKLYKGAQIPNVVQLGPAAPTSDILPGKKLNHILGTICRNNEPQGIGYQFPPGNYELRNQIAKRSSEWGRFYTPDDIVISTGVTEALNISLKVIAKPGDYLITESPTSFATLQIIESYGMKSLEISTHPKYGIDIDSVSEVLNKYNNIAGIFLCSTNSNPLGSTIPDENKKKLYEMFSARNIPIVEDDIYGELYFSDVRPKPIKAFDEKGIVIYCSSFSKTIAPGYRVGWIYPGKYYNEITKHKILTTYTTNTLAQMTIAEFLKTGGYDRTLRALRKIYFNQVNEYLQIISEYFPEGTKILKPQGGFFLWIELPYGVNGEKLYDEAIKEKVSIAPGAMFSTSKHFNNYIRLSCANPLTTDIKNALVVLGSQVSKLME